MSTKSILTKAVLAIALAAASAPAAFAAVDVNDRMTDPQIDARYDRQHALPWWWKGLQTPGNAFALAPAHVNPSHLRK
jgi:hypothetical protein